MRLDNQKTSSLNSLPEKFRSNFLSRLITPKGSFHILKSYLTLALILLNLNNVKFLTFFKKKGLYELEPYGYEHIFGFSKTYMDALGYNIEQLKEYHGLNGWEHDFLNKPVLDTPTFYNSIRKRMMQELLESFLNEEKFNFILGIRNRLVRTKFPGLAPEFRKSWAYNKTFGRSNRALDVVVSSRWADFAETELLNSRFFIEAQYRYKDRFNRPPMLIFNFFKHGILHPSMWPVFYTKMKRTRDLALTTDSVVQMTEELPAIKYDINFDYPARLKPIDIPIKISKKLFDKKQLLLKRGIVVDSSVGFKQPTKTSWLLKLVSMDLPVIFTAFNQLNYLILMLFAELFGDLFQKKIHFAINLYRVRTQIEQQALFDFKVNFVSKIFWFLFFDFWFLSFKVCFSLFYFLKYRILNSHVLWFLLSYWLQFSVYILQYLSINERSILSLYYTYIYKNFFKFKFGGARVHYVLANWGYFGVFLEIFIFFFIFFFILFLDILRLIFIWMLTISFFSRFILFWKYFLLSFFYLFVVFIFNPLLVLWLYCEDFDVESRRFIKLKHLNTLSKGPLVLEPIERFFVGFIFWKTLVKKYWWDNVIEHEVGLKRWPFFYKFSKRFDWFENLLTICRDIWVLFVYFFYYFLKKKLKKIIQVGVTLKFFYPLQLFIVIYKLLALFLSIGYKLFYLLVFCKKRVSLLFFRNVNDASLINYDFYYNYYSLLNFKMHKNKNSNVLNLHKIKSVFRRTDLIFFSKILNYYSDFRVKNWIDCDNETNANIDKKTLSKNDSLSAVRSLYAVHGYSDCNGSNLDSSFIGDQVFRQIKSNFNDIEGRSDYSVVKKYLWVNGLHRMHNFFSSNLVLVLNKWKKENYNINVFPYNINSIFKTKVSSLHVSNKNSYKIFSVVRYFVLKRVSDKIQEKKQNSRFWDLDKFFFYFFCYIWEGKLHLLTWKKRVQSQFSDSDYFKVFGQFDGESFLPGYYKHIAGFLKQHQNMFFNSMLNYFNHQQYNRGMIFLKFLKKKASKSKTRFEIFDADSSYNTYGMADFVSFCNSYAQQINLQNVYNLKFKFVSLLNDSSFSFIKKKSNDIKFYKSSENFLINNKINSKFISILISKLVSAIRYEMKFLCYFFDYMFIIKSNFFENISKRYNSWVSWLFENKFNIFVMSPKESRKVLEVYEGLNSFEKEDVHINWVVCAKLLSQKPTVPGSEYRLDNFWMVFWMSVLKYLSFFSHKNIRSVFDVDHWFFVIWQYKVFKAFRFKFISFIVNLFKLDAYFFSDTFLYIYIGSFDFRREWLIWMSDIFSIPVSNFFRDEVGEDKFWYGLSNSNYKGMLNMSYSLNVFHTYINKHADYEVRRLVSAVRLKKKGEFITDDEMFLRNFLGIEEEQFSKTSVRGRAFQTTGNIVKRARTGILYEFLWIAAHIRFYYQTIIIGFDEKKRSDVFLQDYPEFKPLIQEDISRYTTRTRKKKKREFNKFFKESINTNQVFLNVLPDLWFVSYKVLQFRLWKEHFFFKIWSWFHIITPMNFPFYIYFILIFFGMVGIGFFGIFTFKGMSILVSWFLSYLLLIISTLYMLLIQISYHVLGLSWPLFREILEIFFYLYLLTPDLQSILISLNLYDLFLFSMHNLVQFEADVFAKERVLWLLINIVWIFSTTFLFELTTTFVLTFNLLVSDFADIWWFFTQFTYALNPYFDKICAFSMSYLNIDLSFVLMTLSELFVFYTHYTFIFCFHCLFKLLNFVFFELIIFVFWQLYFFLEYGWQYFWLIVAYLTNVCDFILYSVMSKLFNVAPELMNIYLIYKHKMYILNLIRWDIIFILIEPLRIFDVARFFADFVDIVLFWFIDNYLYYVISYLQLIFWCFCFIINTILLVIINILIFILDCYIFIESGFNFVWLFLFKDIIFSEVLIFLLHCILWFYLNFIYYIILQPFAYIIGYSFIFLKFLVILPLKLFFFLQVLGQFLITSINFIFYSIVGVFVGSVNFVLLIQKSFIHMFGGGLLYKIFIIPFYFVFSAFIIPFKLIFWIFYNIFYLISPLFLFEIVLGIELHFFFENKHLIFLLLNEMLKLIILIFKLNLDFFRYVVMGLVSSLCLFGEILDALFPSLKHMFDPFGGISIFYATVYYYLFVIICYIWSISYRAFNDSSKLPPMPTEIWKEISEEEEDHPLVQRLPFELYQLFYMERVSTRKVPAKFRDSLKTWLPAKPEMNFAHLTPIKNTPLKTQGYYYMLLNGLAKRAILRYYRKRKVISQSKNRVLQTAYHTLGVKEFLHTLKEFPTDLLDTISVHLRFEDLIRMEKPLFQQEVAKPLDQRLNLSGISNTFLLIYHKEEREQIQRDIQLFEQDLIKYYGGGEADEIIFTFPILGRIFSVRDPREDRDQYKIEVVRIGWGRNAQQQLSYSQKEIKKKFLAHFLSRSRIGVNDWGLEKHSEYSYNHVTKHYKGSKARTIAALGRQERGGFDAEGNYSLNKSLFDTTVAVEDFWVKKYRRINVIIELEGDSLADPLFLTVRALDVFLYPLLVFATVNTGWWYPDNGFIDAVLRLAKVEDYARDLADAFESSKELDINLDTLRKKKIYGDYLSNIELFEPQDVVNRIFPTQSTVDKYWEQFAKEYPELDSNFSLIAEQDPYYLFKTFSSYALESKFGENWLNDLVSISKQQSWNKLLFLSDDVTDLNNLELESFIDFLDTNRRNKDNSFIHEDFNTTEVEREINFREKWKNFLESFDENTKDSDKKNFNFLNTLYSDDFLGFVHHLSTSFQPRDYISPGANMYTDYPDKTKFADLVQVEEDEYTKHKRFYDQVASWEAEEARKQRVAAIRKLVEDEGFAFELDTNEGRRLILQYALEHNIITFDFEEDENLDLSKMLDADKSRELTEEELEVLERKAKERFEKAFHEIFDQFDGKSPEHGESEAEKKRKEKFEWFQKQLKRFAEIKHPLNVPEALSSLDYVYNTFEIDSGFRSWALVDENRKSIYRFYQDLFDILDRPSLFSSQLGEYSTSLLFKHEKGLLDYYMLDEYFKSTLKFLPNQIKTINKHLIPIARPEALPYGTTFWDIVDVPNNEINTVLQTDYIRAYLDLQKDYEVSIYKARSFTPYIDQYPIDLEVFTEDLLLGHVFYEYHTTGFLSFFKHTAWQRIVWTIYKVYEGTLVGDIMYEFLHNYFSNSVLFGIGVLPRLVMAWDPKTSMYLSDKFMHGDLAPFRRNFYNAYTTFSFYSHNNVMRVKREALNYFKYPETFSDSWFVKQIPNDPYILWRVLRNHVSYATYETCSVFHTNEFKLQLKGFITRFLSEDFKMFVRWGLYVWFYTSEFFDEIAQYFSTYALFRTLYDLVVAPVKVLLNLSKLFYSLLYDIKGRLFQIYAYVKVNFKIFENIYKVINNFFYFPVRDFIVFFYKLLDWGVAHILRSTQTQFWIDLGFDAWWKRTMMRYLFSMAIDFVSLISQGISVTINPKAFFGLFYSMKFYFPYSMSFREFFQFVDVWFNAWTSINQWYLKFLPSIVSFVYFLNTITPYFPSFLLLFGNFSNFNYSWVQVIWHGIPVDLLAKMNLMPFFVLPVIENIFDYFDPVYNIYEILDEQFIKWYTYESYLTNAVNYTKLVENGLEWESAINVISFGKGLIDIKKICSMETNLYGIYNYTDFEKAQTAKPNVFLQTIDDKPFIIREAIQAPYSIAISDGMVVLTKAEERYLSLWAANHKYSKQDYLAYDFLSEYNSGYSTRNKFPTGMVYDVGNSGVLSSYGLFPDKENLYPYSSFTLDVSPNFYANLRTYERDLGIRKLRYFFNRYQWLISDIFPYTSDFRVWSEIFVDMCRREIPGMIHMRFSNTKQIPELMESDVKNIPVIKISVDIYGNIVYYLEGPEWFVDPELNFIQSISYHYIDPTIDQIGGFFINKVYPPTATVLRPFIKILRIGFGLETLPPDAYEKFMQELLEQQDREDEEDLKRQIHSQWQPQEQLDVRVLDEESDESGKKETFKEEDKDNIVSVVRGVVSFNAGNLQREEKQKTVSSTPIISEDLLKAIHERQRRLAEKKQGTSSATKDKVEDIGTNFTKSDRD